jgi:hypothetical protein
MKISLSAVANRVNALAARVTCETNHVNWDQFVTSLQSARCDDFETLSDEEDKARMVRLWQLRNAFVAERRD